MDDKKLKELRSYYDNTSLTAEIAEAELNTEVVDSPMIGITVRMPAAVLQGVREAAANEGVKTTALIRRWIEERLLQHEAPPAAHVRYDEVITALRSHFGFFASSESHEAAAVAAAKAARTLTRV